MKKLVLLCLVGAVAFAVWKFAGQSRGDDPLADLEHRVAAAEKAYQSAGRAAGAAGIDTSSDAEAALTALKTVERELQQMTRQTTSAELKTRIHRLLDRTAAIRRRIG